MIWLWPRITRAVLIRGKRLFLAQAAIKIAHGSERLGELSQREVENPSHGLLCSQRKQRRQLEVQLVVKDNLRQDLQMAEEDLQGLSPPFSLSFSGSGFLALYQVGVVQSLLELAPELLKSACKVYGSSAGSLIAAAVVCGIGLGKTVMVQISLLWGVRFRIEIEKP